MQARAAALGAGKAPELGCRAPSYAAARAQVLAPEGPAAQRCARPAQGLAGEPAQIAGRI
jgi:hypothetical protein